MSKNPYKAIHLGMDVGSISVNTVILDNDRDIIYEDYSYCFGKPFSVVREILRKIDKEYPLGSFSTISFTGSGGKQAAELLGGRFINEVIAQSSSVAHLYSDVRTIIEMGGEDSKLIQMEQDGHPDASRLSDFSLNSLCAAGTGSFLDQQAKRIGVPIVNEFGRLAEMSENPPRLAGRCSVFAKSDMIHLQQVATPLHDIVAGLCFAVARNFKSTLGRGRKLQKPFIFQGGVAANTGMKRAFREIFELAEDELIIPDHYASMGAIGAVYHTRNSFDSSDVVAFRGTEYLDNYLKSGKIDATHLEPLIQSKAIYNIDVVPVPENSEKIEVYLGLDVGSLSTNVVLIDKDNQVIARRYLPTASKPLDAIRRGLKEIADEVGNKVMVKAAGTTGSGRYLTGDFIGADVIRNEITAQATAAIAYDPTVDTIFEIGGQDSKYISIKNGVVVDFEMNKVCAAGTGSFLEEQAEKLSINIKEEFGKRALDSDKPVRLGDRCTVFMESDLNSYQQKGALLDNLVGGLAYSIVQNYMQKVVGEKMVGDNIFFQGGVTNNKAVVAAFERITGKPITIPPHFDVTGAIGAAMLAREHTNGQNTTFKGFQVSDQTFTVSRFTCKSCSNNCEIQKVTIEGEKKSLFYGGRCEKYEKEERKKKTTDLPNLFEEKIKLLIGDHEEKREEGKVTIGIPRALMVFYQQFPFWRTFFKDLGFNVVISDPSDQQLVKQSLELMVSETCLPMELMHGHVENLLNKGVDYVFLPFIVNTKGKEDNPTNNCNCPWVQAAPFMIKSAFKDPDIRKKFLMPSLHFRYFNTALKDELGELMHNEFSIQRRKTWEAVLHSDQVQAEFESSLLLRGAEIMDTKFPEGVRKLVILGRPYNTADPHLNLSLIDKLLNLNTVPIPVDFLPLESEYVFDDYYMMYWPNGQKMIQGTKLVRKDPDLFAVYLGNFRCGPDSFISHYVRHEMKGKPFLHLEVDEHSADAGLLTRCEAFLDSLRGFEKNNDALKEKEVPKSAPNNDLEGRTLYFPYASDMVHMLAAAARGCGIKSEVLPMQDETDLEIAGKHTTGQECFPMICTTGSFIKKLMEPGCDPSKTAFFMPDHNGPCRFGDYNKMQRLIFDKLGYYEASLVTPSNERAYEELTKDYATRFRMNAWLGSNGLDNIRKLKQENKPYELNKGESDALYKKYLDRLITIVENGSKNIPALLAEAGKEFTLIPKAITKRKPVIAIVGEIFMRDNPFCSAFLVDRLEALGAETMVPRFCEWLHYSTYRYERDSKWKKSTKGLIKSKIQKVYQHTTGKKMDAAVDQYVLLRDHFSVEQLLERSAPYVHRDYDGEPVVALGSASCLSTLDISGVIYILPFTCMPGTIVASVSNDFRKDHDNLPWLNFAYDGQQDASIETHLQAFMHQANQYCKKNSFDRSIGGN